jgi:hypothetical protein
MTFIVTPKTKQQEKVIKAILESLEIKFHTEEEEDKALYNAMQKGRKSRLLTVNEQAAFYQKLKKAE